jgi:hypothetical protein
MWQRSAERFDPEGAKEPKGERRLEEATRTPEIGAENGFWAWMSPRIGLETERSDGARNRTVAIGKEHFLPRRKVKVRWKSEIRFTARAAGCMIRRKSEVPSPVVAGDAKFGSSRSFVAG